ncbi:MAG: 3-oxoacyl-[acyl-carrier-protein] reductase [Oscillospiraceae bacterium]|nr:3-oxoacyl-[acyl-carrier-protein] reductase [Oscillospiraceae bacterium]
MAMSERRVAIVTGAARGIGAAIARRLAADDYIVLLACRDSQKGETVAAECREHGVDALVVAGDVTCAEDCSTLVKTAIGHYGRIDLLVNNAGITRDNLLVRMKPEEWDEVLRTDLTAVYMMMRLVTPYMLRARRGRVVNITSVAGITGNAGQANYAAAKAGVIGLTKSAAKELGSRGILINAVAPGFIETDMTKDLPEKQAKAALDHVSLRRFGKPEEIAAVVSFLASDAASYITGQVIVADGGLAL